MSGRVQTVLGPLDPARLGVTLTHEHVLFERRPKLPPPEPEAVSARALAEAMVEMRHLGLLRRQPSAIHDNWQVADVELAAREVLVDWHSNAEVLSKGGSL